MTGGRSTVALLQRAALRGSASAHSAAKLQAYARHMPSTRGLVGAAGEYYVAAELSRRDWLATVTIKNSPGTDVLAQRLDRRRIVAIQTKTASPGSHFRLNVKDEAPGERDNEWYVLVSLRGDEERPTFYVIPRHVMAAIVYLEHRDWLHHHDRLRAPMRTSQQRKANPMRTIGERGSMATERTGRYSTDPRGRRHSSQTRYSSTLLPRCRFQTPTDA
jgi:hypothetical protein